MSNPALSEEELAAVREQMRHQATRPTPEQRPVDVLQIDQRVAELATQLESRRERFASALRKLVFRELKSNCSVVTETLSLVPHSQLNDLLAKPGSLTQLTTDAGGSGLLFIDGTLTADILEAAFGQTKRKTSATALVMTPVTLRVASKLAAQFTELWNEFLTMQQNLRLKALATTATGAVANVTEAMFVQFGWRIEFENGYSAAVFLLLPTTLLNNQPAPGKAFGRTNLIDALQRAPIEVIVELGRSTVPASALMDLKAGTVLRLNRSVHERLPVIAGHQRLLLGQPTVNHEHLALKITQWDIQEI